jgi:hypothetical protein
MIDAGLRDVTMTPQLAAQTPGPYNDGVLARTRAELSADEAAEWDRCMSEAQSAGTFVLASSYYLAVGTKP